MPVLSLADVFATAPVQPPPAPRSALRGNRARPPVLAPPGSPGTARELRVRAAEYVRMSTDHQQYSTANQRAAIGGYAEKHGLEVVRSYADEGRSGLTVAGRPGLCALLEDIAGGRADFGVLLVFDVSRWGRFQDSDEAACYEFLCRRAGVRVEYCGEPFVNDGSPMSSVVKGLKRVMAGEYSRELSERVFAGKCRLTRMGYCQGGRAVFGLRRQVVDAAGKPRGVLEFGERKYLATDRIVLVPGPQREQRIVRWIFRQIAEGSKLTSIAEELNARGVRPPGRSPWNGDRVLLLVTNEKYIGNLVFNRRSTKLCTRTAVNPADRWVRCDGAIQPIVGRALFDRARAAVAGWSTRLTNEAALAKLRALFAREGRLDERVISAEKGMPGPAFYRTRFGRLCTAYGLVGFTPKRDMRFLQGIGRRRRLAVALRAEAAQGLRERGAQTQSEGRVLVIAGRLRLACVTCRATREDGRLRWRVQVPTALRPDWVLVARLDIAETGATDYYLVNGGSFISLDVVRRRRRDQFSSDALPPLLDRLLVLSGGQ